MEFSLGQIFILLLFFHWQLVQLCLIMDSRTNMQRPATASIGHRSATLGDGGTTRCRPSTSLPRFFTRKKQTGRCVTPTVRSPSGFVDVSLSTPYEALFRRPRSATTAAGRLSPTECSTAENNIIQSASKFSASRNMKMRAAELDPADEASPQRAALSRVADFDILYRLPSTTSYLFSIRDRTLASRGVGLLQSPPSTAAAGGGPQCNDALAHVSANMWRAVPIAGTTGGLRSAAPQKHHPQSGSSSGESGKRVSILLARKGTLPPGILIPDASPVGSSLPATPNFSVDLTLSTSWFNTDIAERKNRSAVLNEVKRLAVVPSSGGVHIDVLIADEDYVFVVYCTNGLSGLRAMHSLVDAVERGQSSGRILRARVAHSISHPRMLKEANRLSEVADELVFDDPFAKWGGDDACSTTMDDGSSASCETPFNSVTPRFVPDEASTVCMMGRRMTIKRRMTMQSAAEKHLLLTGKFHHAIAKVQAGLAIRRMVDLTRKWKKAVTMHAIIVAISDYQDSKIASSELIAQDAKALKEKFEEFGYYVDMMEDSSETPSLLPTRKNVHQMLRAVVNSVIDRDALVVVVVLARGARSLPGLSRRGKYALAVDATLDKITTRDIITADGLMQFVDKFGNPPLVFFDIHPLQYVPSTRGEEIGVGFASMLSRPGSGSELHVTYPKNAAGLFTYYFLRALDGFAVQHALEQHSTISPHALCNFIAPRLQKRNCTVDSNLSTFSPSGIAATAYFSFANNTKFCESGFASNVKGKIKMEERETMARCDIVMLVPLIKNSRQVMYVQNPHRWWSGFLRSLRNATKTKEAKLTKEERQTPRASAAAPLPLNVGGGKIRKVCSIEKTDRLVIELKNPQELVNREGQRKQFLDELTALLKDTSRAVWPTEDPTSFLGFSPGFTSNRIDVDTHSRLPHMLLRSKLLDAAVPLRVATRMRNIFFELLLTVRCTKREARKIDRLTRLPQNLSSGVLITAALDKYPPRLQDIVTEAQALIRGHLQRVGLKNWRAVTLTEAAGRMELHDARETFISEKWSLFMRGQMDAVIAEEAKFRNRMELEDKFIRQNVFGMLVDTIVRKEAQARHIIMDTQSAAHLHLLEAIHRTMVSAQWKIGFHWAYGLHRTSSNSIWGAFLIAIEEFQEILEIRNEFRQLIVFHWRIEPPEAPATSQFDVAALARKYDRQNSPDQNENSVSVRPPQSPTYLAVPRSSDFMLKTPEPSPLESPLSPPLPLVPPLAFTGDQFHYRSPLPSPELPAFTLSLFRLSGPAMTPREKRSTNTTSPRKAKKTLTPR